MHPGGRSPQSLLNLTLTLSGYYSCTLSNCTHRLVSRLTLTPGVQSHAEQPHPGHRLVFRILCQPPLPSVMQSLQSSHSRFSADWPPQATSSLTEAGRLRLVTVLQSSAVTVDLTPGSLLVGARRSGGCAQGRYHDAKTRTFKFGDHHHDS
jgi:hypothetical protein